MENKKIKHLSIFANNLPYIFYVIKNMASIIIIIGYI